MNDDRFVLIVGSPRSGTSLLRRILSNSGELCGHPLEPQYILDLHRRFAFTVTDVAGALELLISHRMFPADKIDTTVLRNALAGRTSVDLSEFLAVCYRVMRGGSGPNRAAQTSDVGPAPRADATPLPQPARHPVRA